LLSSYFHNNYCSKKSTHFNCRYFDDETASIVQLLKQLNHYHKEVIKGKKAPLQRVFSSICLTVCMPQNEKQNDSLRREGGLKHFVSVLEQGTRKKAAFKLLKDGLEIAATYVTLPTLFVPCWNQVRPSHPPIVLEQKELFLGGGPATM